MPSRFPVDGDHDDRLPHGWTKAGYDGECNIYQSLDGSLYRTNPGSTYGPMTCIRRGPATSSVAQLPAEEAQAAEEDKEDKDEEEENEAHQQPYRGPTSNAIHADRELGARLLSQSSPRPAPPTPSASTSRLPRSRTVTPSTGSPLRQPSSIRAQTSPPFSKESSSPPSSAQTSSNRHGDHSFSHFMEAVTQSKPNVFGFRSRTNTAESSSTKASVLQLRPDPRSPPQPQSQRADEERRLELYDADSVSSQFRGQPPARQMTAKDATKELAKHGRLYMKGIVVSAVLRMSRSLKHKHEKRLARQEGTYRGTYRRSRDGRGDS